MAEIRVLMVDDHALFRDGLRAVLEHQADITVVGEAGDADAGVRLAEELAPDVVLMDLHLHQHFTHRITRDCTISWGCPSTGRGDTPCAVAVSP